MHTKELKAILQKIKAVAGSKARVEIRYSSERTAVIAFGDDHPTHYLEPDFVGAVRVRSEDKWLADRMGLVPPVGCNIAQLVQFANVAPIGGVMFDTTDDGSDNPEAPVSLYATAGGYSATLAGVAPPRTTIYRDAPSESAGAIDIEDVAQFVACLQEIRHAVSMDHTNPSLRAVNIQALGEALLLRSIDGYRMAHKTMPHTYVNPETEDIVQFEVNIPGSALDRAFPLLKQAAKDGQQITISHRLVKPRDDDERRYSVVEIRELYGDWWVEIDCGGVAQLKFPDTHRFINPSPEVGLVIDRETLQEALERARVTVNAQRAVMLDIEQDHLVIRTGEYKDPKSDKGMFTRVRSEERIPVSLMEGYPEQKMWGGFNVDFLLDALRFIRDDRIEVMFGGPSPLQIRAEGALRDDNNIHLIMPLRHDR